MKSCCVELTDCFESDLFKHINDKDRKKSIKLTDEMKKSLNLLTNKIDLNINDDNLKLKTIKNQTLLDSYLVKSNETAINDDNMITTATTTTIIRSTLTTLTNNNNADVSLNRSRSRKRKLSDGENSKSKLIDVKDDDILSIPSTSSSSLSSTPDLFLNSHKTSQVLKPNNKLNNYNRKKSNNENNKQNCFNNNIEPVRFYV